MSAFYDEGRYLGEVTQQAMTKAKTGTPQFVLRFRVISLSNGDHVSHQYERTAYRAITEKTMQYFERDLEALGFTGNSLKQLDPSNPGHQSFIGKQFDFNCQHEEDSNGDQREKWGVAWASQGGGAIEGEPVDSASYRQLDALFGRNGKGAGTPAVPARQQAQPRVDQSQEITDEDIPF